MGIRGYLFSTSALDDGTMLPPAHAGEIGMTACIARVEARNGHWARLRRHAPRQINIMDIKAATCYASRASPHACVCDAASRTTPLPAARHYGAVRVCGREMRERRRSRDLLRAVVLHRPTLESDTGVPSPQPRGSAAIGMCESRVLVSGIPAPRRDSQGNVGVDFRADLMKRPVELPNVERLRLYRRKPATLRRLSPEIRCWRERNQVRAMMVEHHPMLCLFGSCCRLAAHTSLELSRYAPGTRQLASPLDRKTLLQTAYRTHTHTHKCRADEKIEYCWGKSASELRTS